MSKKTQKQTEEEIDRAKFEQVNKNWVKMVNQFILDNKYVPVAHMNYDITGIFPAFNLIPATENNIKSAQEVLKKASPIIT